MIDEQNRTPNWIPKILYGALLLTALAIGLACYWAFVPGAILQIKNSPVPIRPAKNMVGNAEILTHNFCKLTNDQGILRISFVGSMTETFLPVAPERSSKACNDKTEFPIVIPNNLVPGIYHVHFRAIYHPNPIKTIIEEWDSQSFEIVAQ